MKTKIWQRERKDDSGIGLKNIIDELIDCEIISITPLMYSQTTMSGKPTTILDLALITYKEIEDEEEIKIKEI